MLTPEFPDSCARPGPPGNEAREASPRTPSPDLAMLHRSTNRHARTAAFAAVLTSSLAVLLALASSAAAARLGGGGDGTAHEVGKAYAESRELTAGEKTELVTLLDEILLGPEAACATTAQPVNRHESGYADAKVDAKPAEKTAYGKHAWKAPAGYEAYYALNGMLAKAPSGWEVLVPEMRLRFAREATTPEARGRMLYLLSWSKSESARALGEELWAERPELFSDDHLVALAEGGSDTFTHEVLVRAGKPGCGLLPAAFAALRGDDDCRGVLVATLERARFDTADPNPALVAAAALGALGETKIVRAAQGKLHDAVLAALDRGELDRARDLALRTEYLHEVARAPKELRLGFLGERMDEHRASRAAETASADQIFTLIEAITPK